MEYLANHSIVSKSDSSRKRGYSPSNDDFFRIDFVMQLVHHPVVLHVDSDLFAGFAVQDGERSAHFDLGLCARTEQCSNDTVLGIRTAEVMVEDGKQGHRVDRYARWCASRKPIIKFYLSN